MMKDKAHESDISLLMNMQKLAAAICLQPPAVVRKAMKTTL
jgi:hypothetical protein